jgi:hypothetical protein
VRGGSARRTGGAVVLAALALGAAACGGGALGAADHVHDPPKHAAAAHHAAATTTTGPPATTTTVAPTTTTTTTTTSAPSSPAPTTPPVTTPVPAGGQHGPITEPPLAAPGPGFVPGQVTAIGDSVMIDYEGALEQDIPGIHVTAQVSRWWTTGETILRQLKAEDALGAVVIVGLATNGPISTAQFDSMMAVLSGASRVVFVNTRVDRTWQGPNNSVLAEGVAGYPRDVLANWYSLAVQHPTWLYSTQTHLPVDGTGAQALAALVADAA